MIDTKLRRFFQPMFTIMAKPFVLLGIPPDFITLLAFLCGVLASLCIAFGSIPVALGLLWVSGLLDILDGTVARLSGKSSRIGAFLDLIFDRMVESLVILGFFFLLPEHALAYLVFFIAVIFNFSTFIVAGALFTNTGNKSMHYDFGLAERTETFLVFTLMLVLPAYVPIVLMVFNGIIFLTGMIRFARILRYGNRGVGVGKEKSS
jgi:phosphatidylglycerophosphate synthase